MIDKKKLKEMQEKFNKRKKHRENLAKNCQKKIQEAEALLEHSKDLRFSAAVSKIEKCRRSNFKGVVSDKKLKNNEKKKKNKQYLYKGEY